MHLEARRGTYEFSYGQEGLYQAMKLCSVFTQECGPSQVSLLDYVELPLSICRNRCIHDRPLLVFLRFDHSKDLPLAKAKLSSFWQFLTNAGLQGAAVKKLRSHNRKHTVQSDQLSIMTAPPNPTQKESPERLERNTNSAHLDGLKNIFDLFLSKGLDKAALAIENDYRVHPYVCVCREPCCNCVKYSEHLHKLGLHHEKKILQAKGIELKIKRKEIKYLPKHTRTKSFHERDTSIISKEKTQLVSEQPKIPLTEKNQFRNVFDNTIFELNLDVNESELSIKKEPINMEECLKKFSYDSYKDSEVIDKEKQSKIRILDDIIIKPELPKHEPIKCNPSVRSVRRNFKEIDPQKYQGYLEQIAEKPDECLMSYQSKKERVLRPKVIHNERNKKPKWRI